MSNYVSVSDLVLAAVVKGDATRVREMIGHGASPHSRHEHGSTLLHWAARLADDRSCLQVMAALIAAGADCNAQSDDGRSPLHTCVEEENEEGARMLVHFGASLLTADHAGKTPYALAMELGVETAFAFLKPSTPSGDAPRATVDVQGGSVSALESTVRHTQTHTVGSGPDGPSVASTSSSSTGATGRRTVGCRTDPAPEPSPMPPMRFGGGGRDPLERLVLGLQRGLNSGGASRPAGKVVTEVGGGGSAEEACVVAAAPRSNASTAPPQMKTASMVTDVQEDEEEEGPMPPASHVAPPLPPNQPMAWPMMLKFGRNTNPAAAKAAAPVPTQEAPSSASQGEGEELSASALGEAVEALRLEELQQRVRDKEGGATAGPSSVYGLGEVHVFSNSKNYVRLEMSSTETLSFGFGGGSEETSHQSHHGGAFVDPRLPRPPAPTLTSTACGPDSTEDLSVDFTYEVVAQDAATKPASKYDVAAGGGEDTGKVVRVCLGKDGKLSDDDFARIKRASGL